MTTDRTYCEARDFRHYATCERRTPDNITGPIWTMERCEKHEKKENEK